MLVFLLLVVLLSIILFFSLIVSMGVLLVSFSKFVGYRESSSPFECGFDSKNSSRTPFSLRFFLMLILFLIFDMEIILVLQFPFFLKSKKSLFFFSLLLFMIFLYIATLEEWRRGFLNWVCEKNMFMNSYLS